MPALAKTCKLWRVFSHPATRRMGIASKLISEALKLSKAHGYKRVALRTHKSNTRALKLYEKCGFALKAEEIISAYYPLKFIAMCYEMDLRSVGVNDDERIKTLKEGEIESESRKDNTEIRSETEEENGEGL